MKWESARMPSGAEPRIWHLVLGGDVRVSVHRNIYDPDVWYASCPVLGMSGLHLGNGLTVDAAKEAGFTAAKSTARAIYLAFEDAAK